MLGDLIQRFFLWSHRFFLPEDDAIAPARPRPGLILALGLLAVFVTLMMVQGFQTRALDDAWITYRFGDHLFEGHGLRWNPGDAQPLEAYTSFTHVLVSGSLIALGLDPLSGSRVLGLLSILALTGLIAYYAHVQRLHAGALCFGLGCIALNSLLGFHASTGMETAGFMLIMTGVTLLFLATLSDLRLLPALFALMLLGVLTRPDAGLLFGLYIGILFLVRFRDAPRILKWLFLLLIVPGLVYVAFKYLHFGELVPNSYTFKKGNAWTDRFPGRVYVRDFSLEYLSFPFLLFCFLMARRAVKTSEAMMAVALGVSVLFYITIQPKVAVGYRFLMPFWPSFILLGMLPLHRMLNRRETPGWARNVSLGLVGLSLIAAAGVSAASWSGLRSYMMPRTVNPAIGKALAGFPDPGKIRLVTGDAGAMPYYSGFHHTDLYGLVSRASGPNPAVDATWVLDDPVDLLITHSIEAEPGPDGSYSVNKEAMQSFLENPINRTDSLSYGILADPRFSRFQLAARVPKRPDPRPQDYYYVFLNPDRPYFESLKSRFVDFTVSHAY